VKADFRILISSTDAVQRALARQVARARWSSIDERDHRSVLAAVPARWFRDVWTVFVLQNGGNKMAREPSAIAPRLPGLKWRCARNDSIPPQSRSRRVTICNTRKYSMSFSVAHIQPIVALIAGILILIMPRLLNYIVAIYLIFVGIVGLGIIK
jgi:hypothetical protein